jgi:hypothetical protein
MAENAPMSMLCLWLQWQENKGEDRIFYLWKELLCMKETKLIHSLIKPLNPLFIYLYQYNFKESFPQINAELPIDSIQFDKSMTNWTTIHSEISSFLQIK